MRFVLSLVMLLAAGWPALADPPKPAAKVGPAVILPALPSVAPSVPVSPPSSVTRLTPDLIYIVQGPTEEVFVVDSPAGTVKVVPVVSKTRPYALRGRFAESPDTIQTKEFSSKYLYLVEPVKTGNCELVIIPKGVTKATDVLRRTLAIDAQLPIPPPAPPTPPQPVPPQPVPPTPPVPPPTPAQTFRVFVVFESGNQLTPAQRGVVYGKEVEAYLNANCTGGTAGWRRRDKDSPGEADPGMAALWAAVKPAVTVVPCVAVERDGKVTIVNVEPTPAAMVAVLKKYKEGQ